MPEQLTWFVVHAVVLYAKVLHRPYFSFTGPFELPLQIMIPQIRQFIFLVFVGSEICKRRKMLFISTQSLIVRLSTRVWEPRQLAAKNIELVIERLRVRIPAGAAEEYFSSPELTFCADSYSVPVPPLVTAVARKRPMSFCQKCWWQVTPKHTHTLDPTKSEWADYAAVQAQCGNLSGNELTRNSSGKHSATVVSAR